MPLLNLPNEVLGHISQYLEQADIFSLIRVNQELHSIFYEHLLRHNVRYHKATALTWAVIEGHLPLARKLLELGGDVNRQIDFPGRTTLLHLASPRGNLPMVKLLFEMRADLNQRDDKGRTPHYQALVSRNEELIREFSSRTENLSQLVVDDSQNQTSLHLAARFWLTGIIRYFVETGIDIDATDKEGKTPLDLAKRALCTGYWHRTSDAAVEAMRLLVVLGEDPAAANWFINCTTVGPRRYECRHGGFDDEPDSHGIRALRSK
ncbi:hypothetical protein AYL99_06041 [Fonsecaea erecta]|uniref:F-box domain-containing protein n=1 Tax=Fonsecaea erecta TaxID=1367422 RepID=A0A178ZMM0_9EURO|nr:hypothetical protein AYL99_06041 [Fonsecaea erecta]OAP61037.1 hypothetical protein AYL99_06041 [Fonsecaea erecta]